MDNETEINSALTVNDLLKHSFEQKPIDFEHAFNSIMVDKLAAAIDDKKLSIAQRMFGGSEEEEVELEAEAEVDFGDTEDEDQQDYEVDTNTELSGEEDNG